MTYRHIFVTTFLTGAMMATASLITLNTATAGQMVTAAKMDAAITVDGDIGDWDGIAAMSVPLKGKGGVDKVELRAAVHGDMIYVLAVWDDPTENAAHKPYAWDDASQAYKKTKEMEDRLAINWKMSGNFSANKIDGSEFEADVWHWKAGRSNPAGLAHDKMWKVSKSPFKKAKKFKTPSGGEIYMARMSDKGDRLYSSTKYDKKEQDVMPRYKVNMSATGSIADVKAKGVWQNGRWYLEMARKLDTGNPDDAVIPVGGEIEFAIAAFNSVGGKKHSVSEILVLKIAPAGS